jgi:hypothetical protein
LVRCLAAAALTAAKPPARCQGLNVRCTRAVIKSTLIKPGKAVNLADHPPDARLGKTSAPRARCQGLNVRFGAFGQREAARPVPGF